ncbi:MAG: phosphoenolpyruvate synthase [Candidatus Bathyarchaeota archaeon]|nr:MAG: phosphoenolpyruvate synthase [Candidatus Bathyarchaeota archaeon]
MEDATIIWLEDLSKDDIPLVGGKNANLGEMMKSKIPVPPGFAITAQAYNKFINEMEIDLRIYKIIEDTVTDPRNPTHYREASKKIRKLIEETEVPEVIVKEIQAAYHELEKRTQIPNVPVAVRSSATAEDLPDASFAGQQETFLNITGEHDLIDRTTKCWSSLFTPRAIFYRTEKGFKHEDVLISVGVQKMVNARTAGVMFTINPVTGDRDQIVIEGSWGLGEAVVSGAIIPDHFVVNKKNLKIIERKIAAKTTEYKRDQKTGKTEHIPVPSERQKTPCLTDEEIHRLAKLGSLISDHYGVPQDIEWAVDRDLASPRNIFIVQSRPETVYTKKRKEEEESQTVSQTEQMEVVTSGLAAGKRDIGIGVAKVVLTPDEASSEVKKGDVLVTTMTTPDFVPFMKLANAIVTDKGGVTAHAAIVSRELGIPCIVGTTNATEKMVSGQTYTVDARNGVVYKGAVASGVRLDAPISLVQGTAIGSPPITATKILMNLGIPEKIEEYRNLPFDGIGLMRIEFILASHIGEHPLHLLEKGEGEKFVEGLADGIAKVARAIQPRPVVVRFSDFKTNEYRDLKGGEKHEIEEANPMLGWRGASRYISTWYEEAFRLECKAICRCRDEWRLKNIWVMLPVIRTLWEAKKCLGIMKEEGLESTADFQVWFMAETPSIAIMADEFSQLCDGFSIGSNDMTQGILMIDRDSERLGQMGYFDERDPAIKRILAHLIRTAHEHGVTVSICGEGPSNLPDFTEFLVRCGIDSISVNNDALITTRRLVASIEQKILLEHSTASQKITSEFNLQPIKDFKRK